MITRWVVSWAAVWLGLTAVLIAGWWWLWPWSWACDDCVPTGHVDDYGYGLSVINWGLTLIASSLITMLAVVVLALVGSYALRRRSGS